MGRDLAIDLGTANTLVYRQGDGIVFDQPTVVALHGGTGEVLGDGRRGLGPDRRRLRQRGRGPPAARGRDDRVRHHAAHARSRGEAIDRHALPQAARAGRGALDELRGGEAGDRGGGPVRRRRTERDAGRGAARGRDRGRPADPRADRQPHRRHRRRTVRDGGRVDGRRRERTVDRAGRLRPGRGDPGAHPRALRRRDRRDRRRGDQDRDRLGVPQLDRHGRRRHRARAGGRRTRSR